MVSVVASSIGKSAFAGKAQSVRPQVGFFTHFLRSEDRSPVAFSDTHWRRKYIAGLRYCSLALQTATLNHFCSINSTPFLSPLFICSLANFPRLQSVRSSVVAAAAGRPIWYPGNEAEVPEYLDGTLAGDYGFDPLGLGSSPEQLAWNVQAELIHGRVAMTGVAGILVTSAAHSGGSDIPEWYEAGKVYMERNPDVSFGALLWTTIALSGWVEFKRLQDIRNPGSQGDGSFLGITDDFKGVSNGYPGGKYFDFMGLSRGDADKYEEYKQKEIKNGRLAMVAFVGFSSQYASTGEGPIANLVKHLADPAHVNAAHNALAVPFISN